jgi:hypothetical protein
LFGRLKYRPEYAGMKWLATERETKKNQPNIIGVVIVW